MLDTHSDTEWFMRLEWKDATSFDRNRNDKPTEGWIQKHPKKLKWKNDVANESILAPKCLYACLTKSVHAPNEMMMASRVDLFSDLYNLRCNLVASDGLKHDVSQVFCWI